MKILKNPLLLLSCLCIFYVGSAFSLPSAEELIIAVNALDEGLQVTRNIHMKMIDRRGKERERDTVSFRKYQGADKKSLIYYTSPANLKDTGFLTFDYQDESVDDDQWLYLPAMRKVRRISAADRGDYFLGTDLTYEDIKKEGKVALEDYRFTTLGEEVIDGIKTFKVEAQTKDKLIAKELGHSKVIMWVDPEISMIRQSLFYDLNGNELKTLNATDIRQVDGIWTRHVLHVQNHKTGHQTIFTFSNVDYKTEVDDRRLNQQSLRKGL